MIDYLFGDIGKPEDAFGSDISEKYSSISAEILIGSKTFFIERKWKEHGLKGKILINDKLISATDFSDFLLSEIGIPQLHFPKGNPFSEKSWPELSWRMMLRHIYRQERFWTDLADKQPESEQHAVLTQLFGIAEKIFPQELGNIVNKRKELYILKAKKDQFQNIFDKITSDLISNKDSSLFATPELLNEQISRSEYEIQKLIKERELLLNSTIQDLEKNNQMLPEDVHLNEKKLTLSSECYKLFEEKKEISKRLDDLILLRSSIGVN